jgi:hypothetical protein
MGGCFEGKAVFITAIYLLRSPLAPESSQSSIGRAQSHETTPSGLRTVSRFPVTRVELPFKAGSLVAPSEALILIPAILVALL